jgi:hypothetical protein
VSEGSSTEAGYLEDNVAFHRMPAGSDRALVSFSARGVGHEQFHFFRLLKSLPDVTKLLVRDPSEKWYNAGLPGSVGTPVAHSVARIRGELDDLGAKRIVTSGASMGGYASILFGCQLGAERVVALCPQTLLDPALPQAPAADVELEFPDLRPIVRDSPDTAIDLVAGWDDLVDVFHALNIADLPSVRVLALKGAWHGFVEEMNTRGTLAPFVTALIEGRTPEEVEVDPQLSADERQRIRLAVMASQHGRWEAAAEAIAGVAEGHPTWAGPRLLLAEALRRQGKSL